MSTVAECNGPRLMAHTSIFVVGRDPLLLQTRSQVLRSAGYTVVPTACLELAAVQFLLADFGLIILCHSIPLAERERVCRLLRQHRSGAPIASIAPFSGQRDSFVDATLENDPAELIAGVRELLGDGNQSLAAPVMVYGPGLRNKTPKTILYVDDDAGVLEVGSRILERAGYRVLAAQDGAEALRLFSAGPIDAVVLDYEMPGMNGAAIASQIRNSRNHVPVILLSGDWRIPQEDRELFDFFIRKADSFIPLLAAVERAIDSAQA